MFDEEELSILEALEAGQFKSSINAEEEIMLAKQAAKDSLNKAKSITLRLNMADVATLKRKAKETGIPYQTLIASIVHRYASGRLHVEL